MKIYIQADDDSLMPKIIEKGDWIDLRVADLNGVKLMGPYSNTLHRKKDNDRRDVVFDTKLISLGVAMKIPKGFEAHVLPRSSTFKKYGIILSNSQGVIDCSYCGPNDIWKFGAIALRDTEIPYGTAIAQFKIVPSQKATLFQRAKWMLCGKIKLVRVDRLKDKDRGGFGSTGD